MCLIQIENKLKSPKHMENFVVFMNNLKSLSIIQPSQEVLYKTFETMKENKIDFDDALIVSIMKSMKIEKLISFDRHFDKIEEIYHVELKGII